MKVGVVGCGYVGSTAAYAMIMRGIGREIVMVDKNSARATAEADDLFHAVPFASSLSVRSGDYADLKGARAVIVAAGVNQRPGETRLQLLERNAAVFAEVIPAIVAQAPSAVLVIATNPVDIMTHMAAHFAAKMGVQTSRVLGSGTTLDTARFRVLLGNKLGIDSHHVHGYVVGEHGDSEVLTWSTVAAGGLSLSDFCRIRGITMQEAERQEIDQRVRKAAYQIIQGKGATYYGIGSALARIVEAILHNQRAVLTVCAHAEQVGDVRNVTLAMPHLLGGEGILAQLPLTLNQQEQAALEQSAAILKGAIESISLN